uniref:G-protein coupled receptors family 1 profile domain-containing protein n=1 Tax=Mandrillus leucophaeus TaxID=9568 RepID=A0A2K5ZI03_MANLE
REQNHTSNDFILLGLLPPNQTGIFPLCLIILIFFQASVGNSAMIHLIHVDARLHTPMYFLLSQLSFMDLMYISTTVPKMAHDFLSGQKGISFLGCGVQSFFFLTMVGSEGLLLTSMAYDRYVAICHPLHYPIRMSKMMCVKMILVCALHIPYCRSRAIDHFFCDVPAMLLIVYEYMVFVSTILFAVYHIHSKEGRKKAFTTISTHLTVVMFYDISSAYAYLWPRNLCSPTEDKILAVFYTILTPMLNPTIYSLRNKEVLRAETRVFGILSFMKE